MTVHMTETGHYTKVISQEQLTSWKQQAKRESGAAAAATASAADNHPSQRQQQQQQQQGADFVGDGDGGAFPLPPPATETCKVSKPRP